MLRKLFAGLVLGLLVGGAHAAADYPDGFTKCVKEPGTCTFSGTRQVAYGAAGQFVYKTLTGSVDCQLATFGTDPYPGKSKYCSYSNTTSGGSSSSSSASSSTSSSTSSSSSSTASGACTPGTTITGTVDCGGKTVGTVCNGQSESQQPVFTLADGATIKNVRINANAADGIHCKGNCTLQNVVWEDVCEDAATMEGGSGKVMNITGGSAANADDKVFQHNGIGSTMNISNFTTTGSIGKLYRSCGDCDGNGGPRKVNITNVKIEKTGSVVGINSNYGDVATIRSLQIKGYKSGSPAVCVTYKGVTDHNGESSKIGEQWNTTNCNISPSDVTAY
ncbi:MAG: pectate lyase [Rhodocyclaceae bacterium]